MSTRLINMLHVLALERLQSRVYLGSRNLIEDSEVLLHEKIYLHRDLGSVSNGRGPCLCHGAFVDFLPRMHRQRTGPGAKHTANDCSCRGSFKDYEMADRRYQRSIEIGRISVSCCRRINHGKMTWRSCSSVLFWTVKSLERKLTELWKAGEPGSDSSCQEL